jgi:hypothetical protein
MMISKYKWNAWLDAAIFMAFVVTTITGVLLWLALPTGSGSNYYIYWGLSKSTWVAIHDWAGVAMLVGLLAHILLHWDWVQCIASRFFHRLPRQARTNFGLDAIVGVLFLAVSISGLISWLVLGGSGYHGGRNPMYNAIVLGLGRDGWNDLHLWTGVAMIALTVLHLALHWKWILCMIKKFFRAAVNSLPQPKRDEEFAV